MKTLVTFAILGLLVPFVAYASCDDQITLTDDQIDESVATLESETSNELAKIRAYNLLCRSDDASMRSLADGLALSEGGDALQEKMLEVLLMRRSNIVLKPYDNDDLTDDHREWISENPQWQYPFMAKSREETCIDLFSASGCNVKYILDYSGTLVSIHYDGQLAELRLVEGGYLEGTFVSPTTLGLRIPVRASLN